MSTATEFTFDVEADQRTGREATGARIQPSTTGNTEVLSTDNPEDRELYRLAQEEPPVEPDESDLSAEIANLKRKLGEQGSLQGGLKAEAAQIPALRAEMDRIRAENAQMKAVQTQQQSSYKNADIFQGIPQDQAFQSPAERQKINEFAVAAAQSIGQQNETIRELMGVVTDLQRNQVRTVTGLSEAEEAQLVIDKPYLNSLTGNDRIQAMADVVTARKTQQVAPQRAANEVARETARTNSHNEKSNASTESLDEAMTSAEAKLLRDMDSGRLDSKQMSERMRKIGIGRIDGYGRNY